MEKITSDTVVSSAEIALCIGLSGRRIYQFIQDGIFVSDKGKLKLTDTIQKYIAYIKKDVDDFNKKDDKLEYNKLKAETLLKTSKAKMADLEAKELEGKMHRSEDVEAITTDLIMTFKNALLSLPGRLAIDVVACNTAPEASEVIQKETYKILEELSDYHYDAERYVSLVRERKSWEVEVPEDARG